MVGRVLVRQGCLPACLPVFLKLEHRPPLTFYTASLHPVPAGYCGLVKVPDEDLVRRDAAPQNVHQPVVPSAAQQAPLQQGALQQQGQQQRRGPATAGSGTSGGARTPPSASPRSSPGVSPFKAAPGAVPRRQQPAVVLAEQAAALIHQQGRLHDAEALLHAALERCATSDTELAGRVVDLLLEVEREFQQTPTHSRNGSEAEHEDHGDWTAISSSDSDDPAALLRQAVEALAGGQERSAVQLLQRGLSACPPDLLELRRRIALYLELVVCKRRT